MENKLLIAEIIKESISSTIFKDAMKDSSNTQLEEMRKALENEEKRIRLKLATIDRELRHRTK